MQRDQDAVDNVAWQTVAAGGDPDQAVEWWETEHGPPGEIPNTAWFDQIADETLSAGRDSNPRITALQAAPLDHSGTRAYTESI